MDAKKDIFLHFEDASSHILRWKRRNRYYHWQLEKYFRFLIPEDSRVFELGCGTGDLLHSVKPSIGKGIDFSPKMIEIARERFPELDLVVADAEAPPGGDTFEYVIMSDLVGGLLDVQKVFARLDAVTDPRSRVIISHYNFLWEPFLRFLELVGLKAKQPRQSWLSMRDLINLLDLEGFECVKRFRKILLPVNIPGISWFFNRFIANLPLINHLCLVNFIVARKRDEERQEYTVSIVVPARNEKGNIENAIMKTPAFGIWQEFIFIEGHSQDQTYEEMLRIQEKYPDHRIKVAVQTGKGKGNAVREGFEMAEGDVLMILDADLTTPPEDMPKFFDALAYNRGEFINGSRLVYPMEKEAMRSLNYLGNKFFSLFFTYLLGQPLKDTLCGTKVLHKSEYERIKSNRSYFGDFDPFGDFDLLFGASKLNMKIAEVPVRYRDREYGSTQISRFKHGWLLIRMSMFAAAKIKFI